MRDEAGGSVYLELEGSGDRTPWGRCITAPVMVDSGARKEGSEGAGLGAEQRKETPNRNPDQVDDCEADDDAADNSSRMFT
jgi:hypothetical protein